MEELRLVWTKLFGMSASVVVLEIHKEMLKEEYLGTDLNYKPIYCESKPALHAMVEELNKFK